MTEKQRVVVDEAALPEYLEKGYRRVEGESLAAALGPAWELLPHEEQAKLVLVEIDAAIHRKLSAPERVYHCRLKAMGVIFDASVQTLDVLEPSALWTLCADAELDLGPGRVLTEELAPSAREAVQLRAPTIRGFIADMRRQADVLETFLAKAETL